MRYPYLFITIGVLILVDVTHLNASILYTVPVEPPVKKEETIWPDKVPDKVIDAKNDLFSEAVSNYKQGKYSEALNKFQSITERYPGSETASISSLYLGSIYHKMAVLGGKADNRLMMDALKSFQESVRRNPDSKYTPASLIEIGRIYLDMGLTVEATGSFKRVIKGYPSTLYAAKAQYLLALSYEKEERYREALYEYRILSMRFPENMEKERVFGMGNIFYSLHEFGEAKRLYEDGLKRWPGYVKGSPEILFNYSECQFQNGEFLRAREGFLTFYNVYPKEKKAGFALNRVGDTYMLEQKGAVAERIYENVLDLSPKSENALISKLATAKVFEAQGKFKDALNIYDDLLDKTEDPLYREISYSFNNLIGKIGKEIEVRLSRNDYFGVIRAYQFYYKNFIDRISDEELLMKIAEAHGRLLIYNEASDIYQKIIERNNENRAEALFKSGEVYYQMGDYLRAVEMLGIYIADYPGGKEVGRARVLMGEGLYNLKEYEKATNHFYAVMRDAPYRYPSVYIKLANILLRSGQYEESASMIRDMLNHLPGENVEYLLDDSLLRAYITLGDAYYGSGRYQDALDAYRTGSKNGNMRDDVDMVQFMIGDCLLRLDRKDDARRIFLKLLEDSNGIIKQASEERLKDIGLNL